MASRTASAVSSPLVDLAPAPYKNGSPSAASQVQYMSFTCQTCSRRKVKCDKISPVCSTCQKAKLECHYQAPPPRRKKRKLSDDISNRLKHYEQVLQANGLLKDANDNISEADAGPSPPEPQRAPLSLRLNMPETARVGKLLSKSGRSRYIDSNLWHSIGTDDINQLSDEEDEDDAQGRPGSGQYLNDPLTGALTGGHSSLTHLHPNYTTAKLLWSRYVANVDPICRVLHTPSVEPLVDQAARDPSSMSKTTECLMFAIYHFAVVSMEEEDCLQVMQEARGQLLARWHHATCQALVNAAFLRTGELPILQAYLLFLLSVRNHYDPHTFWILSGTAWRIGQRMGLHRDGEVLGLPPFEVQMRRRLFWQLLPMDGIAAQISGTGIAPAPDSWDTRQPLNLNEDQIWPGMTHQPEEQEGATDMIFCIARTEIGKFHNKTKLDITKTTGAVLDPDAEETELEEKISKMEDYLERKIVRYCDIVEPLHFLTITLCRGAMVVLRLRVKAALSKHRPLTKESLREVHRLAMKVIDYDITVYQNPGLRRYLWHYRALFLYSALACALTALSNPTYLSPEEIRTAWQKIETQMTHHSDVLNQKRALPIAMGRLTLKAWDGSALLGGLAVEPEFITRLRDARRSESKHKPPRLDPAATTVDSSVTASTSPESLDPTAGLSMLDGIDTSPDNFSIETMDWMYWDQLMQDFQGKPFTNA